MESKEVGTSGRVVPNSTPQLFCASKENVTFACPFHSLILEIGWGCIMDRCLRKGKAVLHVWNYILILFCALVITQRSWLMVNKPINCEKRKDIGEEYSVNKQRREKGEYTDEKYRVSEQRGDHGNLISENIWLAQ